MDRPSRKTNVVNYCESKDFDDDDEDFACVKAPPSKKAREDVKHDYKKSSSKSSSQESNSQSALSQKKRKPLDAKLYERDLEAAITLSLLNPSDETTELSPAIKGDLMVQRPRDENTDPSSVHFSNCSVDSTSLGLDQITSEKASPAPTRQGNTAPKATEEKRSKSKDEDDDYQPKLTPESESDDDFSQPESEDEEIMVKKASKTKKKQKETKKEKDKKPTPAKKEKQSLKPSKPKSQAAVSTPVRSPPVAKYAPEPRTSASSLSGPLCKPASSPGGVRIPKWNPPGQIGKSPMSHQSPAVKSPGQGLRLGLSRYVRVKPLHPSVASH